MYPDRLKSNISKMIPAQWKKLSVAEKQPFEDKHIGDKLYYQHELEAFNVVVGAEKVADVEEANKAKHDVNKRKKAIEKFYWYATKRP